MIQPISRNDYVNSSYSISFGKKPNLKLNQTLAKQTEKEKFATEQISDAKLLLRNLYSDAVMFLSGKKKLLIFDDYTGKLSEIRKFEKTEAGHQLKEVKHLSGNGKVNAIDEYMNGNLAKSTGYQADGKTVKWVSEYNEHEDITKEYYADGEKLKSILVDKGNKQRKWNYDEKGYLACEEVYFEDNLQTTTSYDLKNGITTVKTYENNKLRKETFHYNKGQITLTEISYDENEMPKHTIMHYKNPSEYAEADYEGDVVTLRKYLNNELHFTKITNRKTKEKRIIYASKKNNVKKS